MRPYNPYVNQYAPGYAPGWNPCLDPAYNPYGTYMPMNVGGVPMPQPIPMCPQGSMPYTVQEGDTLYNIARMHETDVAGLLSLNSGLTEMSMLYIGQTICVPTPMQPPQACTCPTGTLAYTVMPGDTLTGIAERFSVSVYALTVANPGFMPENLTPGMCLCIAPFSCLPACVEGERYRIQVGEDLTTLAAKLQVTTDDLLRANPFAPPCWFMPGFSICLPANAMLPETGKKKK